MKHDKLWFGHPGVLQGSLTRQPFICPLDHVLEVNVMLKDLTEEEFGPGINIREYSFLENQYMPQQVKDSWLDVHLCQEGSPGCGVSNRREQDIRIAAQLSLLMDTKKSPLMSGSHVVVVALTNRVDSIDPALRRPGRFDAEVEVSTPNENERIQILKHYAKKLPLDPTVNLESIAASCNGYVGADLEALCREAAMSALKRSSNANQDANQCSIVMDDWKQAKSVVGPSITRGVTVEIPKVSWVIWFTHGNCKVYLYCMHVYNPLDPWICRATYWSRTHIKL